MDYISETLSQNKFIPLCCLGHSDIKLTKTLMISQVLQVYNVGLKKRCESSTVHPLMWTAGRCIGEFTASWRECLKETHAAHEPGAGLGLGAVGEVET